MLFSLDFIDFSHTPDTTSQCFSTDAYNGAATSCISRGVTGLNAIDGFINDPGAGNIGVGHRMFFLAQTLSATSVGAVPAGVGRSEIMCVNVVQYFYGANFPTRDGVISWPPLGYFPFRLLPGSKRWHYFPYASNMDFTNAVVTVTGPIGLIIDVKKVFGGDSQFGNYIVFEVPTIVLSTQDRIYTVVINGITGSPIDIVTYQVIIINI